jgi:hypothetical protein
MYTSRHASFESWLVWLSLLQVNALTWPEAARRYLVAAATALYISAGETKSSATGEG